jgi:uncharacterized membrane protein YgcG
MNKRGVSFYKDWAEFIALILLVIGVIVSLLAGSKVMSYFVVTLAGMMFGRLWYRVRKSFKFTWFLITLGFILGYLIGDYYGNDFTVLILFVIGLLVSYYLHNTRVIESVEY